MTMKDLGNHTDSTCLATGNLQTHSLALKLYLRNLSIAKYPECL